MDGLGAPRRLADILDLQRAGSRLLAAAMAGAFALCGLAAVAWPARAAASLDPAGALKD